MAQNHEIYSTFVHKSRYARYLDEEQRRETWDETVKRYIEFLFDESLPASVASKCEKAIRNHEVMPSMRALMTAGPALERDNVAGYNCAYTPIDNKRAFDEIMYILLCGTGVGFSVERDSVSKLPEVADEFFDAGVTIIVADSKIGWASAFRKLLLLLWDGHVPDIDYSRVRPAGARLATFGGRASGPEPLKELFEFSIATFKNAKGRKLNALECHDLVCKIAESIVCGGVRRSALLSLSNLTDERMRHAKSGQWYYTEGHRALANNSVCYTERPDVGVFLREWTALYESKSGERGIFFRDACERNMPDRREHGHAWGTNPCSEIVLRPRQFCNLTEVVARKEDTFEDLKRKVEIATILGTLQSTLTDFRYLGKKWKQNCEEERLLGVSITGIADCDLLDFCTFDASEIAKQLEELRDYAVKVNKQWAKKLGIPQSSAITCVKPSGTVSQLVNSASGIHPRFSEFYIRRVRNDIKDPISQLLVDYGVPYEVDVTNPNQYVFEFPIKSPEQCITLNGSTAIEQLEDWKVFANHWCEHKPSISVYVREDEWIEVADWVYKNFDILSGVSFFPLDDHVYKQAPYEAIDEAEYSARCAAFTKDLDFDIEEIEDSTVGSQELACAGGACEL